ncbi:50S ribosomal protein L25/general stress protein Ctc [Jatrophihabitans sp.]|uniref:50S ribosomal protein L25/general stress protein Ctc n=1 Tax=Jatrophihabitans sp. TaxID=1932789 RepID=UPI0030C69540|nr:ribosomal protein [Jatrophihabitans sp.]
MSEVRLNAESRTEFGKGGARRTRRAGKIPAVIYGHGAEPRHVALPAREFTNAIRHGGINVLLTLAVEGDDQLVIPKAIQRHALKGTFDHVDLLAVRRGEKVTIDVPLTIVGDVIAGGLLAQDATAVSVEAEATNLPTEIEVSIEGFEIGSQFTAADLKLPQGSVLAGDPSQLIFVINDAAAATAAAEASDEAAEAPAAVAPEAPAAE